MEQREGFGVERKGRAVMESGTRVREAVCQDTGAPIPAAGGRSGVVERTDGAVVWVKWDGDRQAVPYLKGQLEVVA
jgi:hypothetical protein